MPQHPSQSELLAKAKDIGRQAGEDHLKNGTNLSEAIAKHADALFSENFTDLTVAQANHYVFDRHKFAGEIRTEWDAATRDKVQAASGMKKAAAAAPAISSVWDRDIAPQYGRMLGCKTAADGTVTDPVGFKMFKAAKENLSEFNRNTEMREYEKIEAAIRLEKEAAYLEQKATAEAVDATEEFLLKEARAGEPLFDTAINLAAHCDPDFKTAAALFCNAVVQRLAADERISKTAMEEFNGELKTASLDFLENGFPVLRGGEHVVLKINSLLRAQAENEHFPLHVSYKVESIAVPRQSRTWIARDAAVNGHPIS